MLLTSPSAPVLNSWIPHSKDSSSPELEPLLHLQRTKSVSLTCSFLLLLLLHPLMSQQTDHSIPSPYQNHNIHQNNKRSPISKIKAKKSQEEQKGNGKIDSGSSSTIQRLLSCSGLGCKVTSEERCSMENEERVLQTLVTGDRVGRNGGRIGGGAGDGRGSGGGDGDDSSGGSGFF
ncbi:uncharacterized protein LOC133791800 [Humulus lupulus]|uniref:uncharacterized protein LOC133791800 n=1 Tax=Humulus lupulus TaxID=3486 RepID=UPI002B4143DF|nr:uncharacterized protein LOC133791800 [Humulus lupulus]